jgi:OmpA-OmpF porin, OOP family
MNRAILAALVIVLGGFVGVAQADNEHGLYLGAGVGQFNVNIDNIDDAGQAIGELDDDDTSFKAFGGWRFGPFFALELAYIDFGNPGGDFQVGSLTGSSEVGVDGFAPYVVGTIPLGIFELFGKVGYYFYDVDLEVNSDTSGLPDLDSSSSEEDLLYGGGVGVTLFEHLNVRLEYELIDSDVLDDADAIWLSGAWRF